MDDLAARLHVHQPAAPHLLVGSGLQQRLDVTVRKASAALLMTRSDRRRAGADGVRCFDAPDSGRRGTPPWPARHSLRSPGSHGPHEQTPNKWLMVMSRGRHGALKLRCCDPDAAAPNLREPPAAWRPRRAHAERTPNDARPRRARRRTNPILGEPQNPTKAKCAIARPPRTRDGVPRSHGPHEQMPNKWLRLP